MLTCDADRGKMFFDGWRCGTDAKRGTKKKVDRSVVLW
jgi:hypothetical protein